MLQTLVLNSERSKRLKIFVQTDPCFDWDTYIYVLKRFNCTMDFIDFLFKIIYWTIYIKIFKNHKGCWMADWSWIFNRLTLLLGKDGKAFIEL